MRYILFGSKEKYYARGGGQDFLGAGDSVDDLAASQAISQGDIEWWHVFDTKTNEIVAGTDSQAYGAIDLSDISNDIVLFEARKHLRLDRRMFWLGLFFLKSSF